MAGNATDIAGKQRNNENAPQQKFAPKRNAQSSQKPTKAQSQQQPAKKRTRSKSKPSPAFLQMQKMQQLVAQKQRDKVQTQRLAGKNGLSPHQPSSNKPSSSLPQAHKAMAEKIVQQAHAQSQNRMQGIPLHERPSMKAALKRVKQLLAQSQRQQPAPARLHGSTDLPQLNICHPDFLTEEEIDNMTFPSDENGLLRVRKHLIAVAIETMNVAYPEGTNDDHVSPAAMFICDDSWNFFTTLWALSENHSSVSHMNYLRSLEQLKVYFLEFGVDLYDYRDGDLEQLYKNQPLNAFVKTMFSYFFRGEQNSCVVKGCSRRTKDSKQFGGAFVFDSDHAAMNFARLTGMMKKKFCCSRRNFKARFARLLTEFAKTLLTCWLHHRRDARCDSSFGDLPDEPSASYTLQNQNGDEVSEYPPISAAQALDSVQGEAVQSLIDYYRSMSDNELSKVSYEEITANFHSKAPFALVDVHYQTKERWESSTAGERRYSIRRAEITTVKSLCRKCFLCGICAMEMPAKQKMGLDLHHMLELLKRHNPSDGVGKSIEEQRYELRKTIMLCRACHMNVTHRKDAEKRLAEIFARLGYKTSEESGEITCNKPYDGLCVVIGKE